LSTRQMFIIICDIADRIATTTNDDLRSHISLPNSNVTYCVASV
jgi:hypothetical protein